ncbi:unnamed protein product [Pseudo-nitzschia multistriata]|uniref:Uncharacterized protein n=1 Tax=Pseudo-nitzschia multistriata TaxID=183589 RepID=A0A448ZCD9_9STRA|nr:unnamed protein product [Pseudo-nitzschia multistriata]
MATKRLRQLLSIQISRSIVSRRAAEFQPAEFANQTVSLSHRAFSDDRSGSSSEKPPPRPQSLGNEWRKQQLDKLENRFRGKLLETRTIESEEDLQPMWKEMEGRVTRRKARTLADTGGKSGRRNIKKTDEDVWLQEGMYGTDDNKDASKKQ